MMRRTTSSERGFTLVEFLIVVGIVGILAALILIGIDPERRLRQARDLRRNTDTVAVLNAILEYTVDHQGMLPPSIASTSATQLIGSLKNGCDVAAACPGLAMKTDPVCADLASDLVDQYIAQVPVDPKSKNLEGEYRYSSEVTGYYVMKAPHGRIEVGSCNPEDAASIKIRR